MILDTRRLFLALLRVLEIDTVCDVGSMDGADALAFRRALPRARVLAFEANPRNASLMLADARLRQQFIEVLPLAVTNFNGNARFHLVKADYDHPNNRRGMSSLHERRDARLHDGSVLAHATRLDSQLASSGGTGRLALWLDVEGAACEAISGARGLFGALQLLHVEVETEPCIGADQTLFPELERLLRDAGFVRLATNHPTHFDQFNALYVRGDMGLQLRAHVNWHAARLWMRHRASLAAHQLFIGWSRRGLRPRHEQ